MALPQMPAGDEPPRLGRPIATIDDVHAVIRSGKASFLEWLECIAVARGAADWELVGNCARTALAATRVGPRPVEHLREAAAALVDQYIKRARTIEEFRDRGQEAVHSLSSNGGWPPGSMEAITEELARIRNVLVLLADPEPESLVVLSKELRKLRRSDLTRVVATRALAFNPDDVKALTTRAAGAIDDRDLAASRADLEAAWATEPSAHVSRTFSRCARLDLRLDEALRWAWISADLDPSLESGRVLVAAAVAAGDEEALDAAADLLGRESSDNGGGDRWILVVAAEQLAQDGDLVNAERAAIQALAEGPSPRAGHLLNKCQRLHLARGAMQFVAAPGRR